MMIDINDIKNGMTIILEGQIYQIVEFLHVKPGKGSAFMKMKLKNLRAGTTLEKTVNTIPENNLEISVKYKLGHYNFPFEILLH